MGNYRDWLANLFGYSAFDEEEIQKRTTLIILVALTGFSGLIYSIFYLLFGVTDAVFSIELYIGFSVLNLLLFYFSKNYNLFRNIQLTAILLFPTLTHYFNGGFEQSSVVVLAAMLSPLGALMFHTSRAAKVFFCLFIFMIGLAVVLDLYFPIPRTVIPVEVRMIFYFFNIVTITSISFFLLLKFVNDNEKFKELLKIKNHELSKEKQRAEKTLEELKISQSQLIQAEKMASLGELTAGIAHEIQNPLNFVNNFSEINKELLEELVAEIEKGNYDEVKALSVDIRSNEEKIAHHGKRADGIVKGMLQHSRTSSGVKEWSDINEIADEYLRLAYHGLRAKDKSFNAEFRVELDETLPKIKIIPQDIGRVLLNMVNNAFFAVSVQSRKGIPDYVPTVIVTTRKLKNAVEIRVKDNGAGIPGNLLDKIFQPFFTTKPTGEGTGLGLSLSYDIISKGHNGKLDVETREGIGTEFIIELPL
jgi:signal transduction histidine kinase